MMDAYWQFCIVLLIDTNALTLKIKNVQIPLFIISLGTDAIVLIIMIRHQAVRYERRDKFEY